MTNTEANKSDLSFEAAISQLDSALSTLSQGELPLEEAIAQYKVGLDMVRICQTKLTQAENEIKILQNGMEQPFTVEE